uniref:Uncharacterized protein n=1 Tax=Panagrolaimus davidi TaxID=227884 RepID=A0A914NZ98_9BILA
MTSKKVIIWLGALHIIYMFPTIAFYLLSIGNRKDTEKFLIKKWPGIEKHFYFSEACSALSFEVTYFSYAFLVSCVIQFTLIIPAACWLIWKCFNTLMNKRQLMSMRTYRMHYQLLVTLVCQLLVPLSTLILPNTFNALVTLFEIQGLQTIPQVLFILATLHSPLNTIMMLILIKPYRKYIVYAILRIKLKLNHSFSQPTPMPGKTNELKSGNPLSILKPQNTVNISDYCNQ